MTFLFLLFSLIFRIQQPTFLTDLHQILYDVLLAKLVHAQVSTHVNFFEKFHNYLFDFSERIFVFLADSWILQLLSFHIFHRYFYVGYLFLFCFWRDKCCFLNFLISLPSESLILFLLTLQCQVQFVDEFVIIEILLILIFELLDDLLSCFCSCFASYLIKLLFIPF